MTPETMTAEPTTEGQASASPRLVQHQPNEHQRRGGAHRQSRRTGRPPPAGPTLRPTFRLQAPSPPSMPRPSPRPPRPSRTDTAASATTETGTQHTRRAEPVKGEHDLLTTFADLAATAGLMILGWATGAMWWWVLAIARGVLTMRQASLTRRAAAHRRHAA